jgi:hypothetical protein
MAAEDLIKKIDGFGTDETLKIFPNWQSISRRICRRK